MDRLYVVVHLHGDGVSDTWGVFDSLDAARAMLEKVKSFMDASEQQHTFIESFPRNPADPDDAHGEHVP